MSNSDNVPLASRYMSNGRLTSTSESRAQFSWRRFVFILSFIALLFSLNPANSPYTLENFVKKFHYLQNHNDAAITPSWLTDLMQSLQPYQPQQFSQALDQSRTTNWGIFAVEDGVTRTRFVGLGHEYLCDYFHNLWCRPITALLQSRSRKLHANTPAQRLFILLLSLHTLGTLFVLSCKRRQAIVAPTAVLQVFYTIFLPDLHSPVLSYIWTMLSSKVVLLAAIERMQKLLAVQSRQSVFAFSYRLEINLCLSTLALVFLAAGFAAASRYVFNRLPRRGGGWDLLNSAALGYCTATLASVLLDVVMWQNDTGDGSSNNNNKFRFSATAVSWALFVYKITFAGIPDSLEWLAAYYGGYVLGQYQLENQLIMSLTRDIENSIARITNFLFGK